NQKKKRPGKRERRRRARSPVTVAHFVASPINRTSRHGYRFRQVHHSGHQLPGWSSSASNIISLNSGTVTVRAGLYYLYAQDAKVYVRDLEHHTTAVKRQENSFFGLVKLMDAPKTAEELLLG
ncbi:putative TNFSF-like, partial [Homarus americanus]